MSNFDTSGGDIIFQPGEGYSGSDGEVAIDGSFVFKLPDETEFMRIDGDGSVTVRGQAVATNKQVYQAFCRWLEAAKIIT